MLGDKLRAWEHTADVLISMSNFEGPLRTLMAVQEHWNETAQRQRHVQSRASTAYGSKTIEVRSRVQKADMCELS